MVLSPERAKIVSGDAFVSTVPANSAEHASRSPGFRLILLVAASGFAGLGYEMVWTRLLSAALGSEMMAVLGAIAGFFAGLALGSFVLDGPIRRARSPHVVYAALETLIGSWGLISIWLLPLAGRALSPLLGTEPPPTLHWTASFALPVLVLLPATAAMGGTLTALERMASAGSGNRRVSAGIYGANTAGAVVGTLISAFFLFRALGLSGTLLCLAGLNFACAVGALAIGQATPQGTIAAQPATAIGGLRLPAAEEPRLSFTLFLTGLLGIVFEVLVIRLAAQTLQDTIYTFAALLAVYLLGAALGGLLWQRVRRPVHESTRGWLLSTTAFACLATAAIAPYMTHIADAANAVGIAGELAVAIALFLLPSAAMGALFGYLAQSVRDQRGSLGRAVGINSLGAALAPMAATQLLIPSLGGWTAIVLVALGYLLLLPIRRDALAWCAAPAIAGLILLLRPTPSLIHVPTGGELLAKREGPMSTASVVRDASGTRYLEVNGHFRMGGTSSMRSDYRQAMLPLLLHPDPHSALFLGVGTGATLVGGAQMPRVAVRGVELSPEVVELLPWFSNPPSGQTPSVIVADARRYVAADVGQYDIIIADLFHPALEGSGALYTTEHFAAVRKRLAPGGLFCQWLPLYQLDLPSLRAIIRGFLDVYPEGSAWLNHYSVRTPMLALIGRTDRGYLDLHALAERLGDAATGAVVRPIGFEGPMDVLGLYVGGSRTLAAFAGEGPRNTDDYPFVALDATRNVRALSALPSALLLSVVRALHPDPAELLSDRDLGEMTNRLALYWRARDRFLEAGAALRGDPRGLALVSAASAALLDSIRISAEFDPAYTPLLGMARSLMASNRNAAERLLREIHSAAPMRKEAHELLAREFGE